MPDKQGTIHLDSKIITSLKYLIIKPGRLTFNFLHGKRVVYVPPVRLYVFFSFIFFLVLSLVSSYNEKHEEERNHERLPSFIKMNSIDQEVFIGKSDAQVDSIIDKRHIAGSNFNRLMVHQIARLINGGVEGYLHMMIKVLSYSMFFLMPLFALLLFLFNRKSFYIDNLIFSIHFHSFLFLIMTLYFLSTLIYFGSLILFIIVIAGGIYLHKAVYRSFPELKRSYFRTISLSGLYLLFLIGVLLAMIILSILVF